MNNWKKINDMEHNKLWSFIYDNLHFYPYGKKNLIDLPKPNRCFDISNFYNDGFRDDLYEDLHRVALLWFEKISKGERMYALDWQHDCYSYRADLLFEKNEYDEWLIPIFPNGDYLFFLTSDYKNGVFADGINFRLSIWGGDIVQAVETQMPDILVRSNCCD